MGPMGLPSGSGLLAWCMSVFDRQALRVAYNGMPADPYIEEGFLWHPQPVVSARNLFSVSLEDALSASRLGRCRFSIGVR